LSNYYYKQPVWVELLLLVACVGHIFIINNMWGLNYYY